METDSLSDLGEIDGWLADQDNVRHLGTKVWRVGGADLPDRPEIVVVEHSPRVESQSR